MVNKQQTVAKTGLGSSIGFRETALAAASKD